ncbi:MAG: PKD domain-containing protein [Solirubrobacteraceae bacterium]
MSLGGGARVAINDRGDALAVWSGGAAERPAGGTWSKVEGLSPVGFLEVALNERGDAVVVSSINAGTDPYQDLVKAQSGTVGGSWSAPKELSRFPEPSDCPCETRPVRVALDGKGNAVAVWEGTQEPPLPRNRIVQAATRSPSGDWSDVERLSTPAQAGQTPDVGVDGQGTAVAVWRAYYPPSPALPFVGPSNGTVQTASHPAGGSWGARQDLTPVQQTANRPRVAVNERGDAVAVWVRSEFTDFVVAANRPAGGAWGQTQDLSTNIIFNSAPQVAIDSEGDAVASWQIREHDARVAGYDAAGPQLRSLQVPAAATPGSPVALSVAPVDVWSAVASTRWQFGDGSRSEEGTTLSHSFAAPGSYVVTVTSTDSLNNVSSEKRTVVVTSVPAPLVPAPSAAPVTEAPVPLAPPSTPTTTPTTRPTPAAIVAPAGGGVQMGAAPAAGLSAAEATRARALRRCLGGVARHGASEKIRARRGSASKRARARGHMRRHAAQVKRRCLARYGHRPGKVAGVAARAAPARKVMLSFLAPGSDGARPPAARRYVVKQSVRPIVSAGDFKAAQSLCAGTCRFGAARVGERLTLSVTDLRPATRYYYAVSALDNVSGRLGPRSRTASVRTR